MRADSVTGKLAEEIMGGSVRALSRGLTFVERGGERAEALVECLYPHTGRAHIVGITGSPGSGKSTLTRALARAARQRGYTVGIIAVDPSSPFTGGSILGDRIRMNDVAVDLQVFIRSLATRGALGGLCSAAADSVDLMDAAGRELIFVETVGVGQDEVDIMQLAHSVVVVTVPGLGDEVQMLKAGILEIAHIHALNKSDRDGADRTLAELRSMMALTPARGQYWEPPVFACTAIREEGIASLLDALVDHWSALGASGELARWQQRVARARVLRVVRDLVGEAAASSGHEADGLLDRVVRRELPPRACARALLARMAQESGDAQNV